MHVYTNCYWLCSKGTRTYENSSIFHLLQKSKESDVSREANFQEEIQTALNKIELLERELNILKKDKQVLIASSM